MELSLQWFAGFFDGEGYVGFTKRRNTYYPRVTVSNTYLPALKMIQAQFGGSLHTSYGPKNHRWERACYSLHWGNKKAIELLERLLPFLVVKKGQVEVLLAGWKPGKPYKQLPKGEQELRMQIVTKLRELKKERFLEKAEVYEN